MNRNKKAIKIATAVCATLSVASLVISAIINHKRKTRFKLPEPLTQRVLAAKHLVQLDEEDKK